MVTEQELTVIIVESWLKGVKDGIRYEKKSRTNKTKRRAFTKQTKKLVLIYQGSRCNMCGELLSHPDFDHTDGNKANNSPSNCQALCPNCHAKKTRK